uniref:Anion transporter n=1 Tax=Meloidogyne hapla TaxID=6305 RepID=A0A1I8BS04_MELHA
MFPAGTPPNAIVFSAKILHVSDMIIGGLVLKIGSFILCQVFAQTFAPLVFDFDSLNVSVSLP